MDGLKGLPRGRSEQRPPRLRKMAILPTGPRVYRLEKRPELIGGPGEPPPGFVGATNSRSEWIIYWALAKVLGDPENPRNPPFRGGEGGRWTYQKPYLGGRDVLGGSVIDFIVYAGASRIDPRLPFSDIGIFLDTERFHIFTTSRQQANDLNLKIALSHIIRIEIIYEQDIIGDASGEASIIKVKEVLAGTAPLNPITGMTAQRIRI